MAGRLACGRVSGHHPRWARIDHPARAEDRSVLDDLTVRRATVLIAAFTLGIGLGAGLLMRVFDDKDFNSAGDGLWWAVQTITTVGYGDKVPTTTEGQLVAVVVMVTGLGFMSVVTAAITAAFVEAARRRRRLPEAITLDHIAQRLDQIEAALVNQRLEADQRDADQADGEGVQQRDLHGGPG
jgi:voltage-gated potassium channel